MGDGRAGSQGLWHGRGVCGHGGRGALGPNSGRTGRAWGSPVSLITVMAAAVILMVSHVSRVTGNSQRMFPSFILLTL